MRAWHSACLGAVAAASAAVGQVEVRCRPVFARFLQFESVRVEVTVRNETAAPLTLDPGAGEWTLSFSVETTPDSPLQPLADALGGESWTVPPNGEATRSFNLSALFGLQRQGPYSIAAAVTKGEETYESGRSFIDLVPGMTLLERRVALSSGGRRTLTLRGLSRGREERLFLRVDDSADDATYGAQDLGPLVRLFEPDLQMDAGERIHVLHQSSPTVFLHTTVSADGQVLDQVPCDTGGAQARLVRREDGAVEAVGGRAVRNSPLPKPPAPDVPRRAR
jgi:hypothetical protein